jgi:hypothetical protein
LQGARQRAWRINDWRIGVYIRAVEANVAPPPDLVLLPVPKSFTCPRPQPIPAVAAYMQPPVELVQVGQVPPEFPATLGALRNMTARQLYRLSVAYNEPGMFDGAETVDTRRAAVEAFARGHLWWSGPIWDA